MSYFINKVYLDASETKRAKFVKWFFQRLDGAFLSSPSAVETVVKNVECLVDLANKRYSGGFELVAKHTKGRIAVCHTIRGESTRYLCFADYTKATSILNPERAGEFFNLERVKEAEDACAG